MEATVQLTAQDRWEIFELLSRYTVAIDFGRDVDDLLAVFTEEGVIDGPAGIFRGHDEIRKWATRPPTPGLRHTTSNVRITGDSSEAVLTAYFTNVKTDMSNPNSGLPRCNVHMVGMYRCTARKDDGVWRFTYRLCQVDGMDYFPDVKEKMKQAGTG